MVQTTRVVRFGPFGQIRAKPWTGATGGWCHGGEGDDT